MISVYPGQPIRWWTQPTHWVTTGFLVAIFFAPWGSAPRYGGWAISLGALAVLYLKGQRPGAVLSRGTSMALVVILLFGGVTTAFLKQDAYLWVKGFSLPVEFAFSIWLAAWVFLHEKNGIFLWLRFWYAGTAVFLLWGLGKYFLDPGGELLFSNINSLGLYICFILPLLLGMAVRQGERSVWVRAGEMSLVMLSLVLLLLSFSISAWAAGALQVLLFFLLLPSARRTLLLLAGLLGMAVLLLGNLSGPTAVSLEKRLDTKIVQLRTLTLLEPTKKSNSTRARLDIAKVSTRLFKERPFLGWGWGKYAEESRWLSELPGFEKLHPEAFAGSGHSMYLNLLVRGGVVALVGVSLVHVMGVARLLEQARLSHRREVAVPALILVGSIFLYSLGGDVFDFRFKAAVLFWSVLGLGCMNYQVEANPDGS